MAHGYGVDFRAVKINHGPQWLWFAVSSRAKRLIKLIGVMPYQFLNRRRTIAVISRAHSENMLKNLPLVWGGDSYGGRRAKVEMYDENLRLGPTLITR
jgi:hypothetical protein